MLSNRKAILWVGNGREVRRQEEFVIDKSETKMLESLVNTLRCFEENIILNKKVKKQQHSCLDVGEMSIF